MGRVSPHVSCRRKSRRQRLPDEADILSTLRDYFLLLTNTFDFQAIAHMVHLPIPYLNSFALAYTVSRVLYNIVYYNQVGFMSDSARTGMLSVVARALRSALIFRDA